MSLLPHECAIAFKEWSEICQVLAGGRQSLIVRKGGIREGPCGFHPEHQAFWLYPTYVYQAQQGLRDIGTGVGSEPQAPTDPVSIRALAVVECVWNLRSEDKLPALAPFHYWTDETLRTRYRYRQPGLWVLGVPCLDRKSPGRLLRPRRSWVQELGDPELALSTALLRPVLDDAAWSEQMGRLRVDLGPGTLTEQSRSPA